MIEISDLSILNILIMNMTVIETIKLSDMIKIEGIGLGRLWKYHNPKIKNVREKLTNDSILSRQRMIYTMKLIRQKKSANYNSKNKKKVIDSCVVTPSTALFTAIFFLPE